MLSACPADPIVPKSGLGAAGQRLENTGGQSPTAPPARGGWGGVQASRWPVPQEGPEMSWLGLHTCLVLTTCAVREGLQEES